MNLQEAPSWQTFTFGTWNVRGLAKKKIDVIAEIERENEDIVVLSETKIRGVGREDLGRYVHLHSGITYNGGVPRAGVSILVKKELSRNLEWDGVNERLIWAKLSICNHPVVIIGAYWVDECRPRTIKDEFQSKLKAVIDNFKDNYEIIILGDFNAWVGTAADSDSVGEFGVNELNNNGLRLKNVCIESKLKIQNTFFRHRDIHKYTWYGSGSKKSLVDYCITKQDSKLKVLDVVACRWLECGTDHVFVEATISFPFFPENQQCVSSSRTLDIPKYQTYLLFSKTVRALYKEHLEFLIDLSVDRTTNEMYEHLKESIHTAAQVNLGLMDQEKFGEFLWDSEIRELRWSRMYQGTNVATPLSYDYNIDGRIKNEIWEGICVDVNSKGKIKKCRAVRSILEELLNIDSDEAVTLSINSLERYFKNRYTETRNNFIKSSNFPKQQPNDANKDKLPPISVTDVEIALDDLDFLNYSAPGGLNTMLLKYSSTKTKVLLRNLIQCIFNGESIPEEISETYIYVIPNSKSTSCSTVQVIHPIMNIMCSLLRKILENMSSIKNASISYEQPLEATFILRLLLQKNATKQNDLVHFVVIDLVKSYESVPLTKLFEMLFTADVDKNLIGLIEHLTEGNSITIIKDEEHSEAFQVNKGLKPSCTLASLLYNIYINEAVKAWRKEIENLGIRIENHELCYLYSEDKLTLFANNKENLESMLMKLQDHFKSIGLEISAKNMSFIGNENLRFGDDTIAGQSTINYQGSLLEKNGGNEEDVISRIMEIKKMIGLLHPSARDDMITDKNKRRIFNSLLKGFLTYGCETWTVTEPLKRQLEAVELRYWKWCCERFTGKLTSSRMYELMNVNQRVSNVIMLKKAAWYTKLKEMSNDQWTKRIFEWEPEGKRKATRPRVKWVDGVEDFITAMGQYSRHLLKKERFAKRALENIHKEKKEDSLSAT